MIQELRITNFLSFKEEVTFSFEATSDNTLEDYYIYEPAPGVRLLKLAMVYGANASGKSNLINAFGFLRDTIFNTVESKEEEINFQPFQFDNTRNKPGRFELVFWKNGVKYVYLMIVNNEFIHKEQLTFYPGTQPAIIFDRYIDFNTGTSVLDFGAKIKISKTAKEEISLKTLRNISVFSAYSQINISIPEIDNGYNWFKDQLMDPINPYTTLTDYSDKHIQEDANIKKLALQFIKKADFNITDIIFDEEIKNIPEEIIAMIDSAPFPKSEIDRIKKEKVIHIETTIFEHEIVKEGKKEYFKLPEESQSKGTMRYYGLSAPFFNVIKNKGILLIDEIGSALHPLLVIHFIKEFLKKSESAQLLLTTHNMSILNEKDILRKDAVWFTEKGKDGATNLISVADFPDFRKELSYYNYYKLGKFGGVPNLD